MRGQVGYWGSRETGGMCVGFSRNMLDWLDTYNTDRKVFVSVSKERKVIVLPDIDGGLVSPCGSRNHSNYRYVSSRIPASLFMDIDIPPFKLHEVEFKAEEGCLVSELANDYELPWPQIHLDCTTYEAEQIALEALRWRVNSLVASGRSSFAPGQQMPDRLRTLLPPGAWAECLKEARILAGIN